MGFLSGKKLILVGLVVFLLAAIPFTVYFAQQQQRSEIGAQATTNIYFTQPSPSPVAVGQTVSLDVMMNPGSNLVSFVRLIVTYDATKLELSDGGLVPNATAFPSTLEGPTYAAGQVSTTLSVGADTTRVIQTTTKIATLNFKTKAATSGTQVEISPQTQVLSSSKADAPSENVLQQRGSATIVVSDGGGLTPTATPSATTTPTSTPQPTTSTNQVPRCDKLTADKISGTAPLLVTFTANGNDPDGTVSKVTFNFGDGPVLDVTQAGGIGTGTVSAQTTHTYNTAGIYKASAIVTDNNGGISSANACTQTISVGGSVGAATPTATMVPAQATTAPVVPSPTIASPGPGGKILGLGTIAAIFTILGGLLFFAL